MTRFKPTGNTQFQLEKLLNGGLELADNLRGALLEVELDSGENTITHDLGFVPEGYIVLYKSEDGNIYGSRIDEWSRQSLFLKSSVANQTARLFVV